ncbi:hypothetical protein E2C01_099329 [Portunus trituberculatus]|uniref:Uncharacterized protein n=1 Tax=Portunus trituberculatus TaxID=210409 RepID=A0A5B7K028_PORTR|nr:hypothetical protein [Portunus trituberculatus]
MGQNLCCPKKGQPPPPHQPFMDFGKAAAPSWHWQLRAGQVHYNIGLHGWQPPNVVVEGPNSHVEGYSARVKEG